MAQLRIFFFEEIERTPKVLIQVLVPSLYPTQSHAQVKNDNIKCADIAKIPAKNKSESGGNTSITLQGITFSEGGDALQACIFRDAINLQRWGTFPSS